MCARAVCAGSGRIVLCGGFDGRETLCDVWESRDGGRCWWQLCAAPWPPRACHALFYRDGSFLLAGGNERIIRVGMSRIDPFIDVPFKDDMWTSEDGRSWTKSHRRLSSESGFITSLHAHNMFIINGVIKNNIYRRILHIEPRTLKIHITPKKHSTYNKTKLSDRPSLPTPS
jgi:hypothetical protein